MEGDGAEEARDVERGLDPRLPPEDRDVVREAKRDDGERERHHEHGELAQRDQAPRRVKIAVREEEHRREEGRLGRAPRQRAVRTRDERGDRHERVEPADQDRDPRDDPPRRRVERREAQVELAHRRADGDARVDRAVLRRGAHDGAIPRRGRIVGSAEVLSIDGDDAIGEPETLAEAVPGGEPDARHHHVRIDEHAADRMPVPSHGVGARDHHHARRRDRHDVGVPARRR